MSTLDTVPKRVVTVVTNVTPLKVQTTGELLKMVTDNPAGIALTALDDLGRQICKRCVASSQVTVFAKRGYLYVPDTQGCEAVRETWSRLVSSIQGR